LDTTVSDLLRNAIRKNVEHWTQADKNRIAKILQRLRWKRYRKRTTGGLEWRYRPPEA